MPVKKFTTEKSSRFYRAAQAKVKAFLRWIENGQKREPICRN